MNSYRRGRRRPRRRSVNFKSFGYVVEREATFYVLSRSICASEPQRWLRSELARMNRTQVHAWFARAYHVFVAMEVYR